MGKLFLCHQQTKEGHWGIELSESIIYIRNNGDQSTLPCMTPPVTVLGFEVMPSIETYDIWVRQDDWQDGRGSVMPKKVTLDNGCVLGSLSKALVRSGQMAAKAIFRFARLVRRFRKTNWQLEQQWGWGNSCCLRLRTLEAEMDCFTTFCTTQRCG